jgi:hypothetical protein
VLSSIIISGSLSVTKLRLSVTQKNPVPRPGLFMGSRNYL